jgi:hypothetical protein
MKLLACLFIGVSCGFAFGGRQALDWARRYNFSKADKSLRASLLANAAASLVACFLLLGWPFRPIASTTAAEVSETVLAPVQRIVTVPYLWVFQRSVVETHEEPTEVHKTVMIPTTTRVFDPWLVPMAAILACISCVVELAFIRFQWWVRG